MIRHGKKKKELGFGLSLEDYENAVKKCNSKQADVKRQILIQDLLKKFVVVGAILLGACFVFNLFSRGINKNTPPVYTIHGSYNNFDQINERFEAEGLEKVIPQKVESIEYWEWQSVENSKIKQLHILCRLKPSDFENWCNKNSYSTTKPSSHTQVWISSDGTQKKIDWDDTQSIHLLANREPFILSKDKKDNWYPIMIHYSPSNKLLHAEILHFSNRKMLDVLNRMPKE